MTNDSTIDTDITDSVDSTEADPPEPMRILRAATCPSLSGRSELTYHVGCNDSGAIHFRLWANTGAGMFNNIWFSMVDVSELLSTPDGITSTALQPLWESTSRNNAGFTLAILQGEGLVAKSLTTQRTYCTVNPAPFLERINALIASGVDLPEDAIPQELPSPALPIATKRGRPKKT
jgi:hypothetical protein